MDDDFVYVSSAYCPESERLGKKIFGFLIDFTAWTCIGLFLASIYNIAVFDQNVNVFLDKCGPYEFWFHAFVFFSLVGLYWSRHFYAWLWRMFRRVFSIATVH